MVALYKDPKGEKIFSTTPGHHHDTLCRSQSGAGVDKVVISAMEKRIKELEMQLQEQMVSQCFYCVCF